MQRVARLLASAPEQVRDRPRVIRSGRIDGADTGDTVTLDYSAAESADDVNSVAGVQVSFSYSSTEDGAETTFSPAELLGASFGLLAGCTEGSYLGTLPARDAERTGPTFEKLPTSTVLWFSCAMAADPDRPDRSGRQPLWTMGWTSSNAAWLATGPDRATVELIVASLVAAAR